MTAALVGSLGAVTLGTSGAAVTPAYGQTPTAGNLLILWVSGWHGTTATFPVTPAGWTLGPQARATTRTSSVFYLLAAGGDAQPTIAIGTAMTWGAMLGEFSGLSGLIDKSATAEGTASPAVATNSGTDVTIGELACYVGTTAPTSAATDLLVTTGTNFTKNDTNNAGTSIRTHYCFGYGITTANSVADKASMTFVATSTNNCLVLASFLLPSLPVASPPQRAPLSL